MQMKQTLFQSNYFNVFVYLKDFLPSVKLKSKLHRYIQISDFIHLTVYIFLKRAVCIINLDENALSHFPKDILPNNFSEVCAFVSTIVL